MEYRCNHVDEFYPKWISSYKSNPDFPKSVLGSGRAYIHFLAELSPLNEQKGGAYCAVFDHPTPLPVLPIISHPPSSAFSNCNGGHDLCCSNYLYVWMNWETSFIITGAPQWGLLTTASTHQFTSNRHVFNFWCTYMDIIINTRTILILRASRDPKKTVLPPIQC